MSLVLRRIRSPEADYGVIWVAPGGTEIQAGRISRRVPEHFDIGNQWWWGLHAEHRAARHGPHEGTARTLEDAKAAFLRCWENLDPKRIVPL
jgi:hypothetical protein